MHLLFVVYIYVQLPSRRRIPYVTRPGTLAVSVQEATLLPGDETRRIAVSLRFVGDILHVLQIAQPTAIRATHILSVQLILIQSAPLLISSNAGSKYFASVRHK